LGFSTSQDTSINCTNLDLADKKEIMSQPVSSHITSACLFIFEVFITFAKKLHHDMKQKNALNAIQEIQEFFMPVK
jgi:hypothetical protein